MNQFVRDLNLAAPRPNDGVRIKVIVNGLPLFHGAQLAVDTTIVSAVKRDGTPRPRAAHTDSVAIDHARRLKERTYPELSGEHGRARLVVFAMEVGGRWSSEAYSFVRQLAEAKARGEPELLRKVVTRAWQHRWISVLSIACQRAITDSLRGG